MSEPFFKPEDFESIRVYHIKPGTETATITLPVMSDVTKIANAKVQPLLDSIERGAWVMNHLPEFFCYLLSAMFGALLAAILLS